MKSGGDQRSSCAGGAPVAPHSSHASGTLNNGGGTRPHRTYPTAKGPCASSGTPRRYAALDLGTNNCRLLIAEARGGGFRVVDGFSRIVRLGEGLFDEGTLCEEAMDRAVGALKVCASKLESGGVSRARIIATEACRAARNSERFTQRVLDETGLNLEVVDRETEARLAVAGCSPLVDDDARGVVLFDIGGGSSEIVWLDLTSRYRLTGTGLTRCIRAWASLPVGVVTLAERYGGQDVDEQVYAAMVDDVAHHLKKLDPRGALSEAVSRGGMHLLGTSGTVTTLAGLFLGLKRYDRRMVDGTWLDDAQVGGLIAQLQSMSFDDRVANPCIGADRADLVLAGCAILDAIRTRWPCDRLRVADRGLREGMLMELIEYDRLMRSRRRHRAARREGPSAQHA